MEREQPLKKIVVCMEQYCETIQMKVTQPYFHAILFITL